MDKEKSVGTILKEARLAKNFSLADVEKGTSIRWRYIEAIENDAYDKTPGEVFVKGIIRNYGNFLGLDGSALVTKYKASVAGIAAEQAQSKGIREVDKVRLNIQLKDKRDIGSGTGKFEIPSFPLKQCLAGMAAAAVLVLGYFAIPAAIDYVKSMPVSEPKQEQQQVQEKSEPLIIADNVIVEMEAGGECWLEVTADGKEIFVGLLQPKEKKTFEAKDKLIIKYGNIGAVNIKVNGQLIDLKGEHGVSVKTYTRDSALGVVDTTETQSAESEPKKMNSDMAINKDLESDSVHTEKEEQKVDETGSVAEFKEEKKELEQIEPKGEKK